MDKTQPSQEINSSPDHTSNHQSTKSCFLLSYLRGYYPRSSTQLLDLPLLIKELNQNSADRHSRSAPSISTHHVREASTTTARSTPPVLDLESLSARTAPPSIIKQAILGVFLYVLIGVVVYVVRNGSFEGHKTFPVVDGLYFTVVSLCTVGYGDLVPNTHFAKLFVCAFILVGFGFVDILLNGILTYVLDKQEAVLLGAVDEGRRNAVFRAYVVDVRKGRMRVRMKVCLALAVVTGCIAVGTAVAHALEGLSWLDSFYLSVTSVTTVGYGDYAFSTVKGRAFAAAWLPVSTLAVAKAFLYLTELRIEKRNRRTAEWVLKRKMTAGDLMAADIDHNGSIRYA